MLVLLHVLKAHGQDMKNFSFHVDATSGNGTEGDITGLTLVGVTLTGSTTSNRAATFEVADSIGTYTPVKCTDIDTLATVSSVTLAGNVPHRVQCPVGGFKKFRVRISGGTTGTLTAVGLGLAKAYKGVGGGGGGGGGGDALQSLPLSQFAPTTSAQLSGVLTNETGTGSAVFGTGPTITAPIGILKSDVGLGNVDNTSDADKSSAAGTLTNKTINFANNTILTTLAQLNTAITDANVVPDVRTVTIAGTSDEIVCTGGAQDLSTNRTWTCSFAPITDFNGQQLLLTRGTTLPGTCTAGQVFFDTDAPSGQNLYGCTATNIWTLLGDGTGAAGTVTISGVPATGEAAQWASSTQITGVAVTGTGLYVKGTSPNIVTPTGIVKSDVGLANVDNTSDATKNSAAVTLTNKTINLANNTLQTTLAQLNTAVTDANVVPEVRTLAVNGTTDEITCTGGTQDLVANRSWTCSFAAITDFNGQQLLLTRGTALPGTCTPGQIFFDTDAPSGQNLYGCTATNVWTLLGDGTGAAGSVTISGTPTTGQISQFTSATQITGVNTTGTGNVVKGTSPNITTPTGIVKGDVGLANVDNTSDATKNSAAATLTSKTIDFSNNTILTTLAQLNAAITDANVVPESRTATLNGTVDEITCTGGTQDMSANRTWTCSFAPIVDFNGQQLLVTRGTSLPGTCTIGQIFFDTDAPSGQNLYGCTTTNGWSLIGGSGSGDALTTQPLSQFAPTTSAQLAGVLTNETGTGLAVFGTSPTITAPVGIVKADVGLANVDNTSDATKNSATATLTNKTIDFSSNTITTTLAQLNTAISDANVVPETRTVTLSGTTDEITCTGGTQDLAANRTWTCSFAAITDFNGQQLLLTRGTAPPGTCTIGQVFFDTDATAGQNIYGCTATNVWTLIGGSGTSGHTIQDEGTNVASQPLPNLNFAGAGVTCAPDVPNGRVTCTIPGGGGSGDITAVGTCATGDCGTAAAPLQGMFYSGSVAPATPAAGSGALYFDSTSKNIAIKDDTGVVNHGVRSKTAVTSQWLNSIADNGTFTSTQPAVADLSDGATLRRLAPRVFSHPDTATVTSNADLYDEISISALSQTTTFSIPTGSIVNGQYLRYKIYSTTKQTLVWTLTAGGFSSAGGLSLPVTTVAGKEILLTFRYSTVLTLWVLEVNSQDTTSVVTLAYGATIQPNVDGVDVFRLATFTGAGQFLNPLGTPRNGQRFQIFIISATAQTITWDTKYSGQANIPLPTATSGGSAVDVFGFQYDLVSDTYLMIATTQSSASARRRTCAIVVGDDDPSSATVTDAKLTAQYDICMVPSQAIVEEITVKADAGTPNVVVHRRTSGGTVTALLSAPLATNAAGALNCARISPATAGYAGITCTTTLTNTVIGAGDWIGLTSGTAGGTARRFSIMITYMLAS